MKKQTIISRVWRGSVFAVLIVATGVSMSCMTTYDAQGRPVQSVDPGMAVAGAAAAGLVGYAIANNNRHHHKHHDNRYYGHRPPHPGYRRY